MPKKIELVHTGQMRSGSPIVYHRALNEDARVILVRNGRPILELTPLDDATRAEAESLLERPPRSTSSTQPKPGTPSHRLKYPEGEKK